MSKLKALITDVTFTLKAIGITQVKNGRKTKDEQFYVYEGTNGGIIKFCSHPTRSFVFMVLEGSNNIGRLCAVHVTETFCAQAMSRGEKSFNEAIATLKI
jgi:hypothetical protein